jgi:hypothetical protein
MVTCSLYRPEIRVHGRTVGFCNQMRLTRIKLFGLILTMLIVNSPMSAQDSDPINKIKSTYDQVTDKNTTFLFMRMKGSKYAGIFAFFSFDLPAHPSPEVRTAINRPPGGLVRFVILSTGDRCKFADDHQIHALFDGRSLNYNTAYSADLDKQSGTFSEYIEIDILRDGLTKIFESKTVEMRIGDTTFSFDAVQKALVREIAAKMSYL